MKLSTKEKNMIYVCVLLAIGVLTYLLAISPMSEAITDLTAERDTTEEFLNDINYNASMDKTFEEWLSDTKTTYLADRTSFEDVYATEDADRLFTEDAIEHGLIPVSFDISPRDYSSKLWPYNFSASDSEYSEALSEGMPYSKFIYKRSLSFTGKGPFEKALGFVDDLKNRSGVIIREVTFSPAKDSDFSDSGMTVSMLVSFDIYTYDSEGFCVYNNIYFD